ncbi:PQQ-binding-like beta-propeller repeat protein [Streptomyces sp. NPDC005355]|uniref:outer membrane protein assembly factor BamB family protein n=1 Tax=Streptomyces sp. NPDC005355 TaxID=3157038 RepID=UPI0033ABCAEC
MAGGEVLASQSGELTAFDAKSGKRAWPADLPKNCRTTGAVSFTVRTAVAIRASCPRSSYGDDTMLGIDTRSGAVRWHLPNGHSLYLPLGDEKVFAGHWDGYTRGAAIDLSGAEPEVRTVPDPDLGVDGHGQTVVSMVDVSAGEAERPLRARSTRDGRALWTRKAAKDTRLGQPRSPAAASISWNSRGKAGGLTPGPGPARLLVLDLTSGDLLHTAALPKLPLDGDEEQILDPWIARDGVVAVGWSGMFTNRDPDLAVIGG